MTVRRAISGQRRTAATFLLASWGSLAALALHSLLTHPALPDLPPLAPTLDSLDWWSTTPVERALGGAGRLVLVAVFAYVLLVAASQVLTLLAPGTRLARLVGRLTPGFLAVATAGVIAAGGPAASAAPADPTTPFGGGDGPVTMEVVPSVARPGSPAAEPRTSMPTAPPTTAPPTTAAASDPTADGPGRQAVSAPSYVVQRGDHLWNIAERAVALDGAAADDSVVARYWRLLIEHNRHRLVDPGDPDLILPGQQIELPSVSDLRGR